MVSGSRPGSSGHQNNKQPVTVSHITGLQDGLHFFCERIGDFGLLDTSGSTCGRFVYYELGQARMMVREGPSTTRIDFLSNVLSLSLLIEGIWLPMLFWISCGISLSVLTLLLPTINLEKRVSIVKIDASIPTPKSHDDFGGGDLKPGSRKPRIAVTKICPRYVLLDWRCRELHHPVRILLILWTVRSLLSLQHGL